MRFTTVDIQNPFSNEIQTVYNLLAFIPFSVDYVRKVISVLIFKIFIKIQKIRIEPAYKKIFLDSEISQYKCHSFLWQNKFGQNNIYSLSV